MLPGSISRRRVPWAIPALGLTILAAACSSGSTTASGPPTAPVSDRPSSPAKVEIITPTNGEVIHGSTVAVKVKLSNATIVPQTSTNITPTEGHLHLYLDDQIESMNVSDATTIGDVSPGLHTLKVEFVATDHLPFDPRVIAQVAFEAKG
jgi:Family of unknown function (DUF6130)